MSLYTAQDNTLDEERPIALSYIISTFNKYFSLREVLSRLIEQLRSDEEIIVIDGGSTDGTAGYLHDLLRQRKIHYFVSEADRGEAHGFNKGIVVARGELIKVITDDDVFDWSAIRRCKAYMLEHPQADVLASSGAGAYWSNAQDVTIMEPTGEFQKWKDGGNPFAFPGIGLMIRRTSIPKIGLLHTGFKRVDAEYSLRITALRVNLVWYTGFVYVRILNPRSVATLHGDIMDKELIKLERLYDADRKASPIWVLRQRLERAKSALHRIAIRAHLRSTPPKATSSPQPNWPDIYENWQKWLENRSVNPAGKFLESW